MNVRLSVGTVWNVGKGMRTAGWCMVFLGILAGVSASAAAEDTALTRTTLAVATKSESPRTRLALTAHVTASDPGSIPLGVVNFRSGQMNSGLDLGSAFVDGEGNASLETDVLPAGSHQIVAIYQGSTAYQASLSTPEQVQANVSTVAGFTVSATPTSLSTAVGGFVSSVVTVTPINGFSGYVSLSCTGLPVNSTCNFTPLNVLANCTSQTCTAGTSVMQIQTLAPSAALHNPFLSLGEGGTLSYAFVFPALLGLAGLGAGKRQAWRNLTMALLALSALTAMTACSQRYRYLHHGPPGNPGTPTGNYIITVQAQSSTGSTTITPPTYPQLTLTLTGD